MDTEGRGDTHANITQIKTVKNMSSDADEEKVVKKT